MTEMTERTEITGPHQHGETEERRPTELRTGQPIRIDAGQKQSREGFPLRRHLFSVLGDEALLQFAVFLQSPQRPQRGDGGRRRTPA